MTNELASAATTILAAADVHEAADLACVDSVEGWLSLEEARALRALAARVPRERAIVEIGSYRGRSTVALALGARRGQGARVYAVDPHGVFTGVRGGRFGPEDRAAFYANVARTGVGQEVALVGIGSVAAARAWSEPNIGMLFLDGDHRYEAVRADFAAWSAHLSPCAIVAFDDCDYPDVARLVGDLECDRVIGPLGALGPLIPLGSVGKLRWFEHCSAR